MSKMLFAGRGYLYSTLDWADKDSAIESECNVNY
jgi:hypothetical protein